MANGKAGAPKGNRNTFKGNEWSKALKRSFARMSAANKDVRVSWRRGLDKAADQVTQAAVEGNKDAWQEIANRIEGRPGQSIIVAGDPNNPISLKAIGFADPDLDN